MKHTLCQRRSNGIAVLSVVWRGFRRRRFLPLFPDPLCSWWDTAWDTAWDIEQDTAWHIEQGEDSWPFAAIKVRIVETYISFCCHQGEDSWRIRHMITHTTRWGQFTFCCLLRLCSLLDLSYLKLVLELTHQPGGSHCTRWGQFTFCCLLRLCSLSRLTIAMTTPPPISPLCLAQRFGVWKEGGREFKRERGFLRWIFVHKKKNWLSPNHYI